MVGVALGAAAPTGEQEAAVVIATVVWLAMLTRVRAWWRYVPPPEGAPGRSPGWLVARRNRPMGIVLGGLLVAGGWLALLAHGSRAFWVKAAAAGLLAAMVVGLVTSAIIILYNKPRFLVPPGVRDEPGLLQNNRA